MKPASLQPEDCWAAGGRLAVEVLDDGARVRLGGNREGLVGLARVLLWMAKHRAGADEDLDLTAFAAFEPWATLDLAAPR